MSRQVRLKRIAAAVVLVGGVSCGSQDGPEFIADPSPAATVAAPGTDPTASAPASVGLERESRESTDAVPSVSVPVVSVPEVSVPSVSVPVVSVPVVSVPVVSVPEVSLPVVAEYEAVYDRDDWGPHNSGLCRGAVSTPDPYTGTPIDTCNVDHVVALHEAHESGGWAWPADAKQRFSQDPQNHVASRACVNQSKGRRCRLVVGLRWRVQGHVGGSMLAGSDHGDRQVGVGPRRGPVRGGRPQRNAGRMRRSDTRVRGRSDHHTADHNRADDHCCPSGGVCDRGQDRGRIRRCPRHWRGALRPAGRLSAVLQSRRARSGQRHRSCQIGSRVVALLRAVARQASTAAHYAEPNQVQRSSLARCECWHRRDRRCGTRWNPSTRPRDRSAPRMGPRQCR